MLKSIKTIDNSAC